MRNEPESLEREQYNPQRVIRVVMMLERSNSSDIFHAGNVLGQPYRTAGEESLIAASQFIMDEEDA